MKLSEKTKSSHNEQKITPLKNAPLTTKTDLEAAATRDIEKAAATHEIAKTMNAILADIFALYIKTKNFHWHMSGPHFRDYHLLLDEQAEQLFAMTDKIAERVRKVGGHTLHSIGHISRTQSIVDNDEEYVEPIDMLSELCADNQSLVRRLHDAHDLCNNHHDIASVSLIDTWVDEAERRSWFLFESTRNNPNNS